MGGLLVVSALIGISLGRALGWFDELRVVSQQHLVDLITEPIDRGSAGVLDPDDAPSARYR